MRLFERSGVLYADFKVKGKRFKKSLELDDTPANREYALRNILPTLGKEKKRSFSLESFLNIVIEDTLQKKASTGEVYKYAQRQILSYIEPTRSVFDIKTADVDELVRELSRTGLSAGTIKTYLAPLSLAFNEAMRLDIIQKNPVSQARLPKEKKDEKEIFTKDEMYSIIENATGALKTVVMVGFFVGARIGEILALQWSDIKDGKMTISRTRNVLGTLNAPKSGKKRTFKMPQQLTDFLNSLEQTSDWVLGKEFCFQGSLAKEFKLLQESLKIKPKTTHTMRHTCISLLMSAGENPMLIKNMVGHVDMKMIEEIYGHHMENQRDFVNFSKLMEHKKEHTA